MILISPIGWLDGGTAAMVIILSAFFGLYSAYKSKKLNAKLLLYAGLTIFFIGLLYLGPFTDFLTILITGQNLDNSFGLYGILSYMWIAPALVLAMYIGADLIVPKHKKIIVGIYLILALIFEYFLFTQTMSSFEFLFPPSQGEDLIDSSFVMGSVTFLLIAIFLLSVLIFNGLGFLQKALRSTGELRKKFSSLSFGFILFTICGAFDSLVAPGIALALVRIGMVSSTWFMYRGLKPIEF